MKRGLPWRRFWLLACLGFLISFGAWAAQARIQDVRLGVLSFRPLALTAAQWQPLADYLGRRIPGYRFLVVPLFYPELDQAMAHHELDLILTNPEHYVLLRSRHANLCRMHTRLGLFEFRLGRGALGGFAIKFFFRNRPLFKELLFTGDFRIPISHLGLRDIQLTLRLHHGFVGLFDRGLR